MIRQALGMIETLGAVGGVEAADVMVKTADVKLVGKTIVGGNIVTTFVVGDVAAVKAAVDAGRAAADKTGELLASSVIARPHEEIDILLPTLTAPKEAKTKTRAKKA